MSAFGNEATINVYPNPARNKMIIEAAKSGVLVELYSDLGQSVFMQRTSSKK